MRSSPERLAQKRVQLWTRILKIDERRIQKNFFEMMDLSAANLSKQVADTIQVDINRSFNNLLHAVTHENLSNILHTYAIVNPTLDYCQGMNFIAGFLYITTKSEALSFTIMAEVIKRNDMATLFNTETPVLKLDFYTLDRLISIFLPDLHSHFKVSLFYKEE